jgi:hypothetical protein
MSSATNGCVVGVDGPELATQQVGAHPHCHDLAKRILHDSECASTQHPPVTRLHIRAVQMPTRRARLRHELNSMAGKEPWSFLLIDVYR